MMNLINSIQHQFLNNKFFLPYWEVQTLVLGTFNPDCGEETDYFYGRCQNNFWRTLEEIQGLDNRWFQNNFNSKLEFMQTNKFGCTDIIKSIEINDESTKKDVCGKGYSDQILFTAKKCKLEYHFDEIKAFIQNSKVKKVIHTWGKIDTPKSFLSHLSDLEKFCSENNATFIRDCPSPSGRLRGKEHKKKLYDFYIKHLINS